MEIQTFCPITLGQMTYPGYHGVTKHSNVCSEGAKPNGSHFPPNYDSALAAMYRPSTKPATLVNRNSIMLQLLK